MKALSHLLPTLAETISPRLRKKLDADPAMAQAWDWSTPGAVVTSNGERVSFEPVDGVLRSLENLRCGCLMAPNCLHRLAVLSAFEPVSEVGGQEDAESPAAAPEPEPSLSEKQTEAARALWESATRLLEKGAAHAGVLEVAEIQRTSFSCKEVGLHRAGAAGTRVAKHLRDLRNSSVAFELESLAQDLRDVLLTAHRLRRGDSDWIGTARRAYESIGNRKLFGLYSYPVITASGYAGCVTVLSDSDGRRYEIPDVVPGEPTRAVAVYAEAGKTLPGLSISHRELAGSAVLLQNGTASADGRLGSGAAVRAALSGSSSWEHGEVIEAEILGLEGDTVIALGSDGPLRIATIDHPALPTRANWEILTRWPGRPVRLIGERHRSRERTYLVHALDCEIGRFNLALDRLRPALFPDLLPRAKQVALNQEYRPFHDFERRLVRVAQGGRGTAVADPVATSKWKELGVTCGDFWQAIVNSGALGSRDLRGLWVPEKSDQFGLAWLAAMHYLDAARSAWLEALWEDGV